MHNVLMMAYYTAMWLILATPITLVFLGVGVFSRRAGPRRREAVGVPTWQWYAPALFLLATICIGGAFVSRAIQWPARLPGAAWAIIVLYVGLVVFAVLAVTHASRRWAAASGMLAWLWVGAVAGWVASR